MLQSSEIAAFQRRLGRWYASHGRKTLPWRNTRDPYAIYVSEIMLQQTQVKTVQDRYYAPFLKRFPTLAALAKASQKEVLTAWQGLGYYSRAQNLHKAAKACGGKLPKTVEELVALPGVGQNTAHAVAAFAYHQPVPVMEANVKRVLSRIYALKTPSIADLWHYAEALLDRKNPFDYNQAIMDLGAMVCTRRAPKCDTCPANNICQGKTSAEEYPSPTVKKSVPVRRKHIVVQRNENGEFYAVPRAGKFLGGLYHFGEQAKKPVRARHLGSIRQQYSHFTLEAEVSLHTANGTGKYWHNLTRLKALPCSNAEKKIIALLETI